MIVGSEELFRKVKEHCENGSPNARTRHKCLHGYGNFDLVYGAVIRTINQITDYPSAHPQHLGVYVADAIYQKTRENFSWKHVTEIIDVAGRAGLRLKDLDAMTGEKLSEVCRPTSLIPYGQPHFDLFSVKECVRSMAEAILWLQVVSFLEMERYAFDDPTKI